MPAQAPQTVIISCPHCATRYQVDYGTIGAKGRTVQCAHCQKSWHAEAEPPAQPQLRPVAKKAIEMEDKNVQFGDLAEKLLDEQFAEEERRHQARRKSAKQAELDEAAAKVAEKLAAEEHAAAERLAAKAAAEAAKASLAAEGSHQDTKSAIAPKADAVSSKHDPAKQHLLQLAFWRRQANLNDSLPIARLRRTARMAGLAAVLVVIGGGIIFRFQIVQQFPQLAGVYGTLGLGVNVVGLAFRDVHTVKALQQGSEVLMVDAKIFSVSNQQVSVPPVVVTLLGPNGSTVYQWSVIPKAAELEPGEVVSFETQVTAPPEGANRVNLSFASNGAVTKADDSLSVPMPTTNSDPGKT